MSLRLAAIEVLRELGPMHYQALTKRILEIRPASSTSKTPDASVRATINGDIKKNGKDSEFMRLGRGMYGLSSLHSEAMVPSSIEPGGLSSGTDDTHEEEEASDELRVRTPIFPTYCEVRELLRVWPGRPRKQVTALRSAINELRGTPQNTVDWTDPEAWIPERLSGDDRDLANAIWQSSGKSVNPRHTYGHWLLCRRYKLIDENRDGILRLTEVGREFLHQERGDTEAFLDEREGVAKLLAMVADIGPTRAGGLLAEWSQYLGRYSRFGTQSTFRDTLRRRLNNLLDRGLIAREGTMYSITDNGIDYLQRLRHDELRDGDEYGQLWELVKRQASSVREDLRVGRTSRFGNWSKLRTEGRCMKSARERCPRRSRFAAASAS